jgi:hypothetical protein
MGVGVQYDRDVEENDYYFDISIDCCLLLFLPKRKMPLNIVICKQMVICLHVRWSFTVLLSS